MNISIFYNVFNFSGNNNLSSIIVLFKPIKLHTKEYSTAKNLLFSIKDHQLVDFHA